MPIAIKIENLSKQYRLGLVSTRTLSHDLNRWWQVNIRGNEDPYLKIGETNDRTKKGKSEYVWALRDINLEVEQGEVLGIIGKNGAGKSTLLKILSKVTAPTTGTIKARGRIASLLEVGTGFHPEMTGRENIYMNGAIMGMTKAEISNKFDEIVDFSGVERYIDTPVKRYSSGMMVRLGFAVAAHLEPEILVVDEVLAVGDAEFQKKAIGKMQDVSKGDGRTVLFVSHNMSSIETLCSKAVVFENGNLIFQGNVTESIQKYSNKIDDKSDSIINGIKFCHTDVKIHEITINENNSNIVYVDENNSMINIKITGDLRIKKQLALEARLYDYKGNLLAFYSPGHLYGETKTYERGQFTINESFKMPENLSKGEFHLNLLLSHPNVEVYMKNHSHIKIVSKGISSLTGFEFLYKDRGFLIIKREDKN